MQSTLELFLIRCGRLGLVWTGGLLATKTIELSGAGIDIIDQVQENQHRLEVLNKTLYIPCAFITHFGKCVWAEICAEIWDIPGHW